VIEPVVISLPAPPSTNRLWRAGAGGRIHIDPAYASWRRSAGWELVRQKPDHFPPGAQVAVAVRVGKAKRAKDIDNLPKALLDLLQTHGVIGNDKLVAKLTIERDASVPDGRVTVEVREIEEAAAA
jgi:Holliday junction resolvase RusA-like endonuclease